MSDSSSEQAPSLVASGRSLRQHNLLELYLQRYDRPHTQRAYRNDLADFFGSDMITLDDARSVTFTDVNRYLALLSSDGYSASTIRRRMSSLRGFYDWLMALEVLDHNPAHNKLLRRVKRSDHRDRSIVHLTAEQAERLLAATADAGEATARDHALIYTLIHCVLRRSEAAAMDVEHIRPLGRYWVLDLPHTKGGSDQYIKIPAHVVDELDTMCGHYGISEGPLWRSLSNNNRGGRLSDHSIYDIVKKTARRAGLSEDIGAHTLRHTGCTLALEAGASIQQVQTHARHKNIETTMRYIHQSEKLRDSAADYIRVQRRNKADGNGPAG